MTTAAKVGPQDLPPKGGYTPYQIDRIHLRNVLGGKTGIGLFFTCTFAGFYGYYLTYKSIKKREIEMRSSRLAIMPLLYAERERLLMKQMRAVRDEEADLMKNIPGWEVGTFFGEPIYHTVPKDEYVEPSLQELVAHSSPNEYDAHVYRHVLT
ncbi:NADH dehydrogenase (ubiquinone) B16.6 subunit [Andrena cerasifolii]|uniref:NADH dehydrogenase (ubiquinone) B16.6 subunit n=1 Tax=Andrena cerasifolii TaxID=2819439 RepID=UPI0040378ABB